MEKDTLIRTITALIVAIIDLSSVLGLKIDATQDGILAVVTVLVGIWVWWKDNPITPEAKASNKLMKEMKATRNKTVAIEKEPDDAEVK